MRRTDTAGKLSQVKPAPIGNPHSLSGSAPTRRTESTVRNAHGESPPSLWVEDFFFPIFALTFQANNCCTTDSCVSQVAFGFLGTLSPQWATIIWVSEDRKPPSSLCFSSSSVRSTEWVQLRHFSVVWWVCQSLTPDNFPQGFWAPWNTMKITCWMLESEHVIGRRLGYTHRWVTLYNAHPVLSSPGSRAEQDDAEVLVGVLLRSGPHSLPLRFWVLDVRSFTAKACKH